MASDADFKALTARVAALEKVLTIEKGKLILTLDGATIQLGKFGVYLECREFVVRASSNISIKGYGEGKLESGGTMTIKGSQVNIN